MPTFKSVFTFGDDLEKRIKNLCYDPTPKESIRRIQCEANQSIGMIYPGSKFSGFQSSNNAANGIGGMNISDDQRYEVNVEFQTVNLADSMATGYLTISNLTTEFPELTTFFEAEIIGKKHSFLTRKWDADEDIDRSHWVKVAETKFMGFTPDMDVAFQDASYKYDFQNSRYVFMRWKELFLVPDHKVDSINGASYEGFYYVCADLQNELLDGFYYHHSSTMFQRLDLRFHRERKFQSFEFR